MYKSKPFLHCEWSVVYLQETTVSYVVTKFIDDFMSF